MPPSIYANMHKTGIVAFFYSWIIREKMKKKKTYDAKKICWQTDDRRTDTHIYSLSHSCTNTNAYMCTHRHTITPKRWCAGVKIVWAKQTNKQTIF